MSWQIWNILDRNSNTGRFEKSEDISYKKINQTAKNAGAFICRKKVGQKPKVLFCCIKFSYVIQENLQTFVLESNSMF